MKNFLRRVLRVFNTSGEKDLPTDDTALKPSSILNEYVTTPPSVESSFKIFSESWSSYVPGIGLGQAHLFDDIRVKWFIEKCGGIEGKKVLELGPLEGGHTFMFARAGAQVLSIESNSIAFLKCLIVKNALNFDATFLLGDFRPYLDTTTDTFDFIMASGVLYHMTEPWKLLQDMARVSTAIGIWTHYYDPEIMLSKKDLSRKFHKSPEVVRVGNRDVVSFRQRYLEALEWSGFCGGSASESCWLTRESLLGLLTDLGLNFTILEENRDHPNGPCVTLFCKRSE